MYIKKSFLKISFLACFALVLNFNANDFKGQTPDSLVNDAFSIRINFQPENAPVPPGFTKHSGQLYGLKDNGYTYG